jgi:hypothetical protein
MINYWQEKYFNGGLSTGDKRGTKGSFVYGKNLDIHSNPDQLQVQPKTTKDSGSVIFDLVMFMTSEGINNDIYALGDKGNFYKRSSGNWSLLRTLGGKNAQGLGYFNGLVYFASGDKLGTYDPATAIFNENYQSLTTSTWHPMVCFLDRIIVGDGLYLSYLDASSIWYSQQITLINDYSVKCMDVISGGNWLVVGTEKTDKTDARFFTWDGYSTAYNDVVTIRENGINAITNSDGVVLVNAGIRGNLYQYNGASLIDVKSIPDLEKNLTILSYPGATCNYQGKPLIAMCTGTSLLASRGVYSWSSSDKNYPKVLNLDFTPSHGNLLGTDYEIGSIFSEGENELYISWKDDSGYGVDLVDGSGSFTTAELHTRVFDGDAPQYTKLFSDIKIRLSRLIRSGEKIDVYYKADRASSWTQLTDATIDYAVDGAVIEKSSDFTVRANEIQLKLVITSTSTSTAIDSFIVRYVDEPLI